MSGRVCSLLIYDARASKGGPIVTRPCGAKARYVITMRGDEMFAVCHRHDQRLERAGVALLAAHAADCAFTSESDKLGVPA